MQSIRDARAKIQKEKSKLLLINVARNYGNTTGNFMPLAKALGVPLTADQIKLAIIPQDFVEEYKKSVKVVETVKQ